MLNVTHSSAAQAFYAHMADEASPQTLLADLKGQIDLLAISSVETQRLGSCVSGIPGSRAVAIFRARTETA